jgi:hypothetical protein
MSSDLSEIGSLVAVGFALTAVDIGERGSFALCTTNSLGRQPSLSVLEKVG